MRKKIIKLATVLLLITAVSPLFANEMSAVWSRIYNTTNNLEAKLAVMRNIIDLHDRNMAPVITEALKEVLYARDDSMSFTEKKMLDDLSGMMIKELGNLRAVDAAPEIYKVMNETDDDFLRTKAIVSLGSAGARDYADEIAGLLNYINLDITGFDSNEKRKSVLDACIMALERLKHPVGFKPVFYASIGRYARDTVKKAERALRNMVEDPTDLIIEIIMDDTTFETRLAALEVEERSGAAPDRMTEAATAAIETGLKYNAANPSERQYQMRTRIKACEMIRDLGQASPDAVEWLALMLDRGENINELIICLQALGTYSSDEAVAVLSDYLVENNERRASGIQYKDERLIRECINALANSGNPKARNALMMVEYTNWSNQTIRMAKNALNNL